jgi:hypothetical protein
MLKVLQGNVELAGLAIFVVWMFAVLPFLHGPAPRFAESGSPPQAHTEQAAQQAAAKPDGSISAPFFIRIPKTAKEEAEDAADRHEKSSTDRWLMIFTGAVALFTLLLVGATVLLYRAGERQLTLATDTAQRQLRAYVGITVPDSELRHPDQSLESSEPSIFKMALEIRNSGQTPAYDMITRFTTMLLDHPVAADHDFSRPIGTNPSVAVLNPSAHIRSESEPHPLSADEIEEIKDPNGKRRLYSFGEIKYRDAFNTSRHTHFCFYTEWDGETLIGHVSEHYNDAT